MRCTLEDGGDGQIKIIINKSTGGTNAVKLPLQTLTQVLVLK